MEVGRRCYLLDCGAPLFRYLGREGVDAVQGVLVTHCHDDHKRWLTDLALYRHYGAGRSPLPVLSHGPILREIEQSARPALERTLSDDSRRVIGRGYREFIEPVQLGPRARFRIEARGQTQGTDRPDWRVVDRDGAVLPPERAKVVTSPGDPDSRPRMLFRDPPTDRWVDPDDFYPFSAREFYEPEQNVFTDEQADLSFQAIKSTAWHGPPTISVLVTSGPDRVLFSSDTAYRRELWQALVEEVRPQRFGAAGRDGFEQAHCISGEINDLIEQTWSRERLDRARAAYTESVIIHDVAGRNSVVHTDYADLADLSHGQLLLTHTPDYFISQIPLAAFRKTLVVHRGEVRERVGEALYPLAGDIFVRHGKRYRVGFANPDGRWQVTSHEGVLDVIPAREQTAHELLLRVELYEDVRGMYFPVLEDESQRYVVRPDGQVERVTCSASGSIGVIQENLRPST